MQFSTVEIETLAQTGARQGRSGSHDLPTTELEPKANGDQKKRRISVQRPSPQHVLDRQPPPNLNLLWVNSHGEDPADHSEKRKPISKRAGPYQMTELLLVNGRTR